MCVRSIVLLRDTKHMRQWNFVKILEITVKYDISNRKEISREKEKEKQKGRKDATVHKHDYTQTPFPSLSPRSQMTIAGLMMRTESESHGMPRMITSFDVTPPDHLKFPLRSRIVLMSVLLIDGLICNTL